MKKAFNSNIMECNHFKQSEKFETTLHRHFERSEKSQSAFTFCRSEQNLRQTSNVFCGLFRTKIGENSLPLRGRAGVRGQQAFISRHLEQSKRPQKAFTLAEVLITLAIIGVVAAISIPSVISNAQQQEFKTGLRKAVSVLNSAITMNIALDGESPYDNHDLFRYLQRHMSVMKSTIELPYVWAVEVPTHNGFWGVGYRGTQNAAFYTTDGMRFEFCRSKGEWEQRTDNGATQAIKLHESDEHAHQYTFTDSGYQNPVFKCGSYGLANNPNNTTATPCHIMVDVNGDRKPFPANINATAREENVLKYRSPNSKKVGDTFTILITEDRVIPFGVLAQKAMYQSQK